MLADAGSVVSADTDSTMPASSPPPSYERVLEEVREFETKIAKMEGVKGDEEEEEEEEEDDDDDDNHKEAIEESTDEGKSVVQPQPVAAATTTKTTKGSKKNPGPEIMPYKSSKEFYKAMAKQWGITCKMSDTCRCLDCQSRYFECSYEKYQDYDTYQEQSDGGLSASTPMFVSEIMHGSTCLLL